MVRVIQLFAIVFFVLTPISSSHADTSSHRIEQSVLGGGVGFVDDLDPSVALTNKTPGRGRLNVLEYGAKGDGVTDDTQAIKNALRSAVKIGAGRIYFPVGTYVISEQLDIPTGLHIEGDGFGDDSSSASQPTRPASALVWRGKENSDAAMISVKASKVNGFVYDFFITDISLKCENNTGIGLRLSSTRHAGIGRLWVERCRTNHVLIDDANGSLNAYTTVDLLNMKAGSNSNTVKADGLVIRSDGGKGVTRFSAKTILASTQDGNGVVFGDLDGSSVAQLYGGSSTRRGYSVYFRGQSDGQRRASRKNIINYLVGGNVYAEKGSRNVIDWINSEGTAVTIEPGAVCHYSVIDRRDGRRWASFAYPVDMTLFLPLSDGYAVSGMPSLRTYGANFWRGIAYKPNAVESWQWLVPPLREFSGGRIIGVDVWGYKGSSAGDGDVVFEIGGSARSEASGLGGEIKAKTIRHHVSIKGVQVLERFSVILDNSIDFPVGSHLILRIARLGTDKLDTFSEEYAIVSVGMKYASDVANSEGKGKYRYMPSADFNDKPSGNAK